MSPVLGADVERGVARLLALFQRCEFRTRVCTEKDVVMGQIGTFGCCCKTPDLCRQAACRLSGLGGDFGNGSSQCARGKRSWIAVEQDRACRQAFAPCQVHGADLSALCFDPRDIRIIAEGHAARLCEIGNCDRKAMHAALDAPDARCFCLPDQGQDRRRAIGRAADICCITPEKLCQAAVGELTVQQFGQTGLWCHGRDQRRVSHHV